MKRVVLAVALGLVGCGQLQTDIQKFEGLCTEALAKRLKSPSSLVVSEVTDVSFPTYAEEDIEKLKARIDELSEKREAGTITTEESAEWARSLLEINSLSKGEDPKTFDLVLQFEADNSFGASLSGAMKCTHQSASSSLDDWIDDGDVKIDGETYIEWLIRNTQEISN